MEQRADTRAAKSLRPNFVQTIKWEQDCHEQFFITDGEIARCNNSICSPVEIPCCHSERSEESLVISSTARQGKSQRCFASLNMTADVVCWIHAKHMAALVRLYDFRRRITVPARIATSVITAHDFANSSPCRA